MAHINWRPISGDFKQTVFALLYDLETFGQNNESDILKIHNVNGNPTIGIGFDLKKGGKPVQDAVLVELGFHADVVELPVLSTNEVAELPKEQQIEYGYIKRLRTLMNGGNTTAESYNAIMAERNKAVTFAAMPPAGTPINSEAYKKYQAYQDYLAYNNFIDQSERRKTFTFTDKAEMKSAFDDVWENYFLVELFKNRDGLSNDQAFKSSQEMMAIATIVWNSGPGSGGVFGNNLLNAMLTGDRAAAWYEIRYQSNGGSSRGGGIAKRRYFESQLFGLYDDPNNITVDEAKNIFQILQANRKVILAYEAEFGIHPDGRLASKPLVENNPDGSQTKKNHITTANESYSSSLQYVQGGQVQALENILNPAKDALLKSLKEERTAEGTLKYEDFDGWFNQNITSLVSTNIYMAYKDASKNDIALTMKAVDVTGRETGSFENGANDLILGGDKKDYLIGGKGHDVLIGNKGDDTLNGGTGNDYLYGGEDNDTLWGEDGDDYLDGGSGNDLLYGGKGSDTYVFSKGHGQDTIFEASESREDATDVVKFNDIKFVDVKFKMDGTSLVLYGYNEGDSLTIKNFSSSSLEENKYEIERFEFADKTITSDYFRENGLTITLKPDDLNVVGWHGNNIIQTQTGNHTITTYEGDDVITLGSGNHTVYMGDGTNYITTGSGKNKVYGGEGNDTFVSGSGNDTFIGSIGSDTYIFAKGHGKDVIARDPGSWNHWDTSENDVLKFLDVSYQDVQFTRKGDNLVLNGYNGTDQVTIHDFFDYEEDFLAGEYIYFPVRTFIFNGEEVSLTTLFEDFQNGKLINNNKAPIIVESLDNLSLDEGESWSYQFSKTLFIDPDGDRLDYKLVSVNGRSLPYWLRFDAGTLTLSGIAGNGDIGDLSLKIIATDTQGLSTELSFTLTVNNINDTPIVIGEPTDLSFNEGQPFKYVFSGFFYDPDYGDVLTYSITLVDGSGLPTWLTFDPKTGLLSGTPLEEHRGTLNLRVSAIDSAGDIASFDFNLITGVSVNLAPEIVEQQEMLIFKDGEEFFYNFSSNLFKDPEGKILTYDVLLADGSALPKEIYFSSGYLWGQLNRDQISNLQLKIIATDPEGLSTEQYFTLVIESANNHAPIVTEIVQDMSFKVEGDAIHGAEIQGLINQNQQTFTRMMSMSNDDYSITVDQELHVLISAMAVFDSFNGSNDDFIVTNDQTLFRPILTTSTY